MNQKDYLVTASNSRQYNIRLCEIVATGTETSDYDKLFIIYKTPEGEYLKRIKHFHPVQGAPEVSYEIISTFEVKQFVGKRFA